VAQRQPYADTLLALRRAAGLSEAARPRAAISSVKDLAFGAAQDFKESRSVQVQAASETHLVRRLMAQRGQAKQKRHALKTQARLRRPKGGSA